MICGNLVILSRRLFLPITLLCDGGNPTGQAVDKHSPRKHVLTLHWWDGGEKV